MSKLYGTISRGDDGFPPIDVGFTYAYGKRPRIVRVVGAETLAVGCALAEAFYEGKAGEYVAFANWRWAKS